MLLPGAEAWSAGAGGDVGVLLIHGFTSTPQSLRPWAEHLGAAGLTVSLPRLPGHGTTWREMAITRWEDWYAEADRAFRELSAECSQVFVMGLSMGGTLALRLAQQHGAAVAGLVLVNPSVRSDRRLLRVLPLARLVLPSVAGVAGDIRLPGAREVAYDRVPLAALASLLELWDDVRTGLPRVTSPVLLFRSAVDHVVEPANARTVVAQVSSTDLEERVLPDSFHVATLDHDAPKIFNGSLDFVRRHSLVARPEATS